MITRAFVFVSCVGVALAVGVTASHAQRQRDQTVGGAFAQPFRDLGISRQRPSEILTHAAAVPYEVPAALADGSPNCPAIVSEISALDGALGPDVDVPPERHVARNLVAGAIRSAMHIPYRSVVRRITGAEHREQVMNAAIQAGMVRRAFLKGLRLRDCTPQTQMVSAPAPAGDPALVQTLVGTDTDAVQEIPQTVEASASVTTEPQTQPAVQTIVASDSVKQDVAVSEIPHETTATQ